MNFRSLRGLTIIAAMLAGPSVKAQSESVESKPKLNAQLFEAAPSDPNLNPPTLLTTSNAFQPRPKSPVHFSKTKFILLSTAVYGAATADMHQTMANRKEPWWYETNPLARPFVHLPAPAYYATGLAMATAVNWISWKMAHSRRWHKFAPIPQLLSIGGNLYGFHSNRF